MGAVDGHRRASLFRIHAQHRRHLKARKAQLEQIVLVVVHRQCNQTVRLHVVADHAELRIVDGQQNHVQLEAGQPGTGNRSQSTVHRLAEYQFQFSPVSRTLSTTACRGITFQLSRTKFVNFQIRITSYHHFPVINLREMTEHRLVHRCGSIRLPMNRVHA
ncbi:hypothetical protein T4B_12168 [Trichinella pseudospiralis]|uniref:Uncharacterized protein n=2 Tax=Trichinella pseudospiralis TaxID=6337 RepID=A0A0V0YAI6_TRIPS|nr:hypothetical protein T4E_6444 [Trichinella pseudospiralis]KRY70120.1 hypothetical protein T4A_1594 [Trichinella pseudospiralis]KRY85364.1 hypothetical protein T4D_10862 [Trichinella pseudospiralis]KRZ29559.1 hypothetical protein T4B_12168 [Trichinella pseudospiralis]KRZ36095.1 hypothetical protein T4C_1437 [Trichinella pseudospiralis]